MSTLRDPRSGLLTAAYFDVTVPERVALARRELRPLSLLLFSSAGPELTGWERAAIVRGCLRDADTACQLSDDVIGLILEDTPEDGAVWTAERLRRGLVAAVPGTSIAAGVATYPAHTLSAAELLAAAREALAKATGHAGSHIEVARPR